MIKLKGSLWATPLIASFQVFEGYLLLDLKMI